jgi:hypothetical protein
MDKQIPLINLHTIPHNDNDLVYKAIWRAINIQSGETVLYPEILLLANVLKK